MNLSVTTSTAHNALEDTTFRGYNIPRKADIYANLYGIHLDPKIFPDPEEFKPDRFLDEGDGLINTEWVIPFGIGKVSFLKCWSVIRISRAMNPPPGRQWASQMNRSNFSAQKTFSANPHA